MNIKQYKNNKIIIIFKKYKDKIIIIDIDIQLMIK